MMEVGSHVLVREESPVVLDPGSDVYPDMSNKATGSNKYCTETESDNKIVTRRGKLWNELSNGDENCKNMNKTAENYSDLLAYIHYLHHSDENPENRNEFNGNDDDSGVCMNMDNESYETVVKGIGDLFLDLDFVRIVNSNGDGVVSQLLCLHSISTETWEHIERDIPRTYPDVEYFFNTDVQDSVLRVLRALAAEFPSVGYVQGMNFIAAQLLFHCNSDEDRAFLLFRKLITFPKYDLKSVYINGLPKVLKYCCALDTLLKVHNPTLFHHLNGLGLESMLYAQQWIMTLFAYNTNWKVLAQIWDYFFMNGWQAIFRISLCILDDLEGLLKNSDFEECSDTIRDFVQHMPEYICARAKNIHLSAEEVSIIDGALII
mmetsp:Transcript_34594/g.42646  ORF Transcript_34594/g.42646 Transcript_34594/m.42646 type:complete len:376 (+) Transcript_34594:163-1290(+)